MARLLSAISELLILCGGVIIFLSILRTRRILKLAKGAQYGLYWKWQISLMIFFLVGYITVAYLIYLGIQDYLSLITGSVFFFGALFVYLMVRTGSSTLSHIRKSQDDLEIAINKRTGELQSEVIERKKGEDNFRALSVQLDEAVSRLRSILDAAVEGILLIDTNGKIVAFNKRFVELWQIPQEILATKDDDKALAFVLSQLKDPDIFLNKVKELYKQPEAVSFDVIEFKDGKIVERYSMPERRNGVVVGRVWNFIDVTKTKKAEEILKLSEEKYRRLVEEVVDVVYSADDKGNFTYVNPVCKKMTGYSEAELLGKHFTHIIAPAWKRQVTRFYLNQYRRRIQQTVLAFPILTKSGKEQWVEQTVNMVHNGEVIGYQGICRDVSERKIMEARLESSNQDLENFAYIASHDLQEPLRTVTSFLGLLEKKMTGKMDQDSKEFLDFAVDGALKMKEMINDLLSYSRVLNQAADFKKIDLNRVLKDVLFNLDEKIKESHAKITASPLPKIVADDIKLTRLLQNLVSNAIKFAAKDRFPVIKIGCKEQDDSWLLYVEDNGIGIKKEYFDKIFIIFKRLHSKSEYPGTGIGLAECKKIAELHNGRIWVESEEGKGSTFYVTLQKKLEPTLQLFNSSLQNNSKKEARITA